MVVISKRNVLFRGSNGENYLLKKSDVLTSIPSWVAEQPYFKALCKDGQIVTSEDTSDKAVEAATEIADAVEKEVKKAKKTKAEDKQ